MTTQKRQLSEFVEPDIGGPEQGAPESGEVIGVQDGGIDREGAMAKADLYKLASYSHKLYEKINEEDQLEAWVQAKITKAADYIASVYHYLEYEMKFSEYGHHLDNSDTLSEGQKMKIKEVLAEARSKMRELKVAQSEKMTALEGVLSGGETECEACAGTGMVHNPGATVPDHVKGKVAKYNRQAKAMHAASKRLDKNNNGIPDDEEGLEEATKTDKPWTDKSGKTHQGTAVKGDKYTGKEAEKEAKPKKVAEATKTDKPWTDKSGKTHQGTAVKGDKYTGKEAEKDGKSKDKKVAEASEKTPAKWTDKSGKEHDATRVKGDKYTGKEAEKDAKSKKVAEASAMWQNVKETTAYMMEKKAAEKADKDYDADGEIETGAEEHAGSVDNAIKASKKKETVKESTDMSRMREQLGRLNRAETHQLVESSEADQIRALTKRLLG